MSTQQRESTSTEPNPQADLQAAVQTLNGHIFALEMILAIGLVTVSRGKVHGMAKTINGLPALIAERPGVDARPFFQDGIQATVSNVASQLLELSGHVEARVHDSQDTPPDH